MIALIILGGGVIIEYASHIANWRNGEPSGIGVGKELRIWRREKTVPCEFSDTLGCMIKYNRGIALRNCEKILAFVYR